MSGKGDNIKGYEIMQDWQMTGSAKISFCRKNGEDFFIKRFDFPTYPFNRSLFDDGTIRKKISDCEKFEKHHNDIIKKLNEITNSESNLVIPLDFFKEKAFYYKIYKRVTGNLGLDKVIKLSDEVKVNIFKTAAQCVHILHNSNIIHGDIKLDNIMVVRSGGKYIARVIDFDSSYFQGDVPDQPVGDFVFYSPELARFNQDKEKKDPKLRNNVTTRSDIFALGLVFCRYLTGKYPDPQNDEGLYPWQMVLEKKVKLMVPDEKRNIGALINRMLDEDYNKRPTPYQLLSELNNPNILKEVSTGHFPVEPPPPSPLPTPTHLAKPGNTHCDKPMTIKKMVIMGKSKEWWQCVTCGERIEMGAIAVPEHIDDKKKEPVVKSEEEISTIAPPPNHCGLPMQKRGLVIAGKAKRWYQCLKCGHRIDFE
jgi:eukaryotic-like serine/threonine-protein kinase